MYFDFVTEADLIGKLRLAKELGFAEIVVLSQTGTPAPAVSPHRTATCLLVTDDIKSPGQFVAEKRASVELVAIASANRLRLVKSIQDDRTDLIIPDLSRIDLDKHLISLCKLHKIAVLFPLKPILAAGGSSRASLVRRYSRAFERLGSCKVCLGSLAEKPLDLRAPHELVNFFHHLGLPFSVAKDAVTQTPSTLIRANRKRQKMVAPGVLRL